MIRKYKPCRMSLTESERRSSFYYTEVCDALSINLDWMIKLPFHTVRWAYFQITRTFVRLPEPKYTEQMTGLENWFKTVVFDDFGNVQPRKEGEKK